MDAGRKGKGGGGLGIAVDSEGSSGAQLLERLRRSSQRLEQQRRRLLRQRPLTSIGRLWSKLAHELRGPLAYISATAQYVYTKLGDDLTLSTLTAGIQVKVDRLLSVIDALSTLASPTADRRREGTLEETVSRVLAFAADRCQRQAIHVVKSMPPVAVTLFGDHDRLGAMLSRLVTNALDAMPEGGVLTVRVEPRPRHVRLHVADTGPGIPSKLRHRVFSPFFSTKGDASGLSLVVCKYWVESQGGRLKFASPNELGRGTTFTIELPQRSTGWRRVRER